MIVRFVTLFGNLDVNFVGNLSVDQMENGLKSDGHKINNWTKELVILGKIILLKYLIM